MFNCRNYGPRWYMAGVAKEMRRVAMTGRWRGADGFSNYMQRCYGYHQPTGVKLFFVRQNEDSWEKGVYDFCFNLRLAFYDPDSRRLRVRGDGDMKLAAQWVEAFYGEHEQLVWSVSPLSEKSEEFGALDYRLFMQEDWKTPLLDVKDYEFTKKLGWRWQRWSEVKAELESANLILAKQNA